MIQAQYQKLLVRNRIEAYEISQELNKEPVPINIHDSIDFSINAWNSVSQQTIFNCWKYTGILPQEIIDEIDKIDEIDEIEDQAFQDEIELQDLINELPFDDPMGADEFLHINDHLKSNEELTDNEIVAMVKSNNNNDEPEVDPNEIP